MRTSHLVLILSALFFLLSATTKSAEVVPTQQGKTEYYANGKTKSFVLARDFNYDGY